MNNLKHTEDNVFIEVLKVSDFGTNANIHIVVFILLDETPVRLTIYSYLFIVMFFFQYIFSIEPWQWIVLLNDELLKRCEQGNTAY